MSTEWQYKMYRFFRIALSMLSVVIIVICENSNFNLQLSSQGGKDLYLYIILGLLAVCFLQYQLYNYLIPKNLKTRSLNAEEPYYNRSFFKGAIGAGYFIVFLHLITPFMNSLVGLDIPDPSMNSTRLHETQGLMYIGVSLIFLGTLSKIKGIITNELSIKNKESS